MRTFEEAAKRMGIWTAKKTIEAVADVKLPLMVDDITVLDEEFSTMLLQSYATWDLLSDVYVKLYGEHEFREKLKLIKVEYDARSAKLESAIKNIAETATLLLQIQAAQQQGLKWQALPAAGPVEIQEVK